MRIAIAHRQLVTFYARHGLPVSTRVPSMSAKWRPALLNLARAVAWAEGVARHNPSTPEAEQMLRLFTDRTAGRVLS